MAGSMDYDQKSSPFASALLTLVGAFLCGIFGLVIVSGVLIWGGGRISELMKNLWSSTGAWGLLIVSVAPGLKLWQYFYKRLGLQVSTTATKSAVIAAVGLLLVYAAINADRAIHLWR